MQTNENPPAPVDDPSPHDDAVRWSAVGIGVAVDWVSTLLASLLVAVVAAAIAGSRSKTAAGAEEYLRQLQAAPDFMAMFMLMGLLCVSLGAYVAARRAGFSEVRHGALVGVGSVLLGVLMEDFQGSAEPSTEVWNPGWLRVVGYALVIPFGALGGLFAERTRSETHDTLP